MEIKKSPKANLEKFTQLFWQLGLIITLLTVYVGIEYKTYEKTNDGLALVSNQTDDDDKMEEFVLEQIVQPKTSPPPAPEIIDVVDDEEDVEETIIVSTETDETEVIVDEIEDIEEEEDFVEDVLFSVIEEVPVFPGCKGTKAEKRACLNRAMRKHVARKFNADLASELGLTLGRKRISIQFRITKTGNIEIIGTRAPHPRLKKEAERVIRLLPKMIPGRQRGRPVNVTYMLPITLNIE